MTQEMVGSFVTALLAVDRIAAREIFLRAARSCPNTEIGERLLCPALEQIGLAWERGQASLMQVYASASICEQLVDEILPPSALQGPGKPQIAVAVLEDYHLLGKRMVASVLRLRGLELLDYGRMDVDSLVNLVKRDGIGILLISTLMLRAALRVKTLRS